MPKLTCQIGRRLYSTREAHHPLSRSSGGSLLACIQACNNVQLPVGPFYPEIPCRATSTNLKTPHEHDREILVPFLLHPPARPGTPIGFVRPSVAKALLDDHCSQLEIDGRSCWSFHTKENCLPVSPTESDVWALSFSPHIWSKTLRTSAIARITEKWRNIGLFSDILRGGFRFSVIRSLKHFFSGWSDEKCPVYLPNRTSGNSESLALVIERAALPLFGFPNFGTLLVGECSIALNASAQLIDHLTLPDFAGYCETSGSSRDLKLWIARRSMSKRT
jgi:hypothetical protein